ncbi:Hint domain-containing protein [Anianabacter salinae]|uniref:Hint domain-containing protein n=1 Tax=Anianabacter salinae TaxID=2851023 RepID=UPI00225E0F4F|nr:Hint domain-containing protein [Anianabacter salinae]MBV0910887.1 Hint domain-containing protein [Anianabacter salinae]
MKALTDGTGKRMLYTFGDQDSEAYGTDRAEVPSVSAMDLLRATARNAAPRTANTATAPAGNGFAGFAAGTLIEIMGGHKRAEDLVAGDLVRTVDNGFQPLRWVGRRRFGSEALRRDPSLRPVRIRAHALAEDQPQLDLVVSQRMSILLSDWRCELLFGEDEVLAPVTALLNDHSIMIDHEATSADYVYLMFARHEIVLANGVEAESMHVTGDAVSGLDEGTRAALLGLFPEYGLATEAFGPTARRLLHGYEAEVLAAA